MFLMLKVGVISLITFLIAGCVNISSPPTPSVSYQKQSWQQRYRAQSAIKQWDIEGAFSVQEPAKTVIAAYHWQQKGEDYQIDIRSSFGLYSVVISGKPGYVSLWRASQNSYTANTPEKLVREQLGLELPISNLRYWVRGIPGNGVYQANFDDYGHLVALQQYGWTIYFSHYVPIGEVDVPGVLELRWRQIGVRIIVKRWILG